MKVYEDRTQTFEITCRWCWGQIIIEVGKKRPERCPICDHLLWWSKSTDTQLEEE
jgi:rubrerythrin